MIKSSSIHILVSLSIILLILPACIHDDFEQPERWVHPEGEVLTIAQLKSLYTSEAVTFEEDYSVYGTVTMDDKSGNIYRNAFIQDRTGAINLRMVAPGGIYTGDSVRVYLKGTTLSPYQRLMQLDNVNVDRNIHKLAVQKHVEPLDISIPALLSGQYQGQLIRLNEVQFAMLDVGKPFADKEGLQTGYRYLEDCDGNRVVVQTSGYADFADQAVPEGKGSLVAIATQSQNDVRIYIRKFDEMMLSGDRCAIPGDDYTLISIAAVKQAYRAGTTLIPANSRIEGVIISDYENDNHPGQNLYLTDESGAGITIRFTSFHDFALGTRLRLVFASPMPVSEYRGLVQIENIPLANAFDLGPGTLPEPTTLSIAQAISQMDTYQSTLVHFNQVTISGGTTLSGNLTISDGSGQMLLYTYNYASFHGHQIPSGTVNITGILSFYDQAQLLIRNLQDITQ